MHGRHPGESRGPGFDVDIQERSYRLDSGFRRNDGSKIEVEVPVNFFLKAAVPFWIGGFFLASAALAVPPIDGKFPPGKPPCRINASAMSERVGALRSARAMKVLPPPNTLTNPKVLVLRVQFSDTVMTTSLSVAQTLFQQVQDYYRENSYGVFLPTFTITSAVYSMPRALAYYGADCPGDVACNTGRLFMDAVAAAAGDVTFANYNHLMIYHAGLGQESQRKNTNTDFIWSLYIDQNQTAGGKPFPGYTVVAESESPSSSGPTSPHGIICHEYGHQQGLPDLYDTGLQTTVVGSWDLMDYPYGSTPAATPHLGAWSKYFLGFSAPTASTGTVVLAPAESVASRTQFLRLPHPSADETFFMEYRYRNDTNPSVGFDKAVPKIDGLALWHVDEALVLGSGAAMLNNVVNSPTYNGTGHAGVSLVAADGAPPSDSGDLGNGDLFADGSTAGSERTDSFGGSPSGMTVSVGPGTGTSALTINVVYFKGGPIFNIVRLVNYPNPAGDRNRYPVRDGAPPGTVTTLVLQFSQPVSSTGKIDLDIYGLDGNRVRSFSGSSFALKAGAGEPTTDGKWVYECDWDGRTDRGEAAVSGVYIYRVKVDGETKTGKMVLVR